jgi:hypothetical protein
MTKRISNGKPVVSRFLLKCLVAVYSVLVVQILTMPQAALAGVAVDCKGSADAYRLQGIPCDCINGQIVCSGSTKKGGGKGLSSSAQLKGMVFGAVFESLLTSIFTTPQASEADIQAAQQRAAETAWQQEAGRQAREAEAQAAYERMMQSYKQLDDAAAANFKSISDTNLSFKTLDGDLETIAANARKPFDTPGDLIPPPPAAPGAPTPFFGDTMPLADIKLLANPENDPRVVDLREANRYVVQSIKTDKEKMEATVQKQLAKQTKEVKTQEQCLALANKLNGFLAQRSRFQKTIYQGEEQLNVWEEANRAALVNAAKDGVEYFAGLYLEALSKRSEAAERLQRIYASKKAQMVTDGVKVAEVEAKLNRLKTIGATAGNVAKANDWQAMMKDGISSLVAEFSSSNEEIKAMLEEPGMQKYFTTEKPELNLLLDISKMAAAEKVFGKWVARQVPIIGLVDISIKQIYNGTDWYLSFQRITEANRINGQIMASARSLQQHIDDTYLELRPCK